MESIPTAVGAEGPAGKTNRPGREPEDASDLRLAEKVYTCLAERNDRQTASDAFLKLYDRHSRDLAAYVARVAKPSSVDDIAQDVWRRAWERLAARPMEGPFRPWLFTVARNRITDSFRDAARRRSQTLDEPDSPAPEAILPAIDQGLLDEDVRVALSACLEKLEHRPREVVRHRWLGEEYSAVCEKLGIDNNQAYKAYHHATRQLGECLKRSRVV